MHDGELLNDARVAGRAFDAEPARADRRRDRHGQDEDAAAPGRPAVEGRRARVRGRHQGRPHGPGRARRRRRTPRSRNAPSRSAWTSSRPATRSSSCRSRASSARRSGPRSTRSGRCCSARSSTSTRRRPRSSRWSSSTATTTTCRCSTSRTCATTLKFLASDEGKPILEEYGGMSPRLGRRAAALDRRTRAGGRRHLLRRAGVRRRRPAPHDAGRPGHHLVLELSRRDGQAAAVLDVHALDAGPAVRARCPRSATSRSPSCASSSTRRTCCSTTPPTRCWTRSSGRPG